MDEFIQQVADSQHYRAACVVARMTNNLADRWGIPHESYWMQIGTLGRRYECNRGDCDGSTVLLSDQKTHNQYHDADDQGLPSPFAIPWEDDFEDGLDYMGMDYN